MMRNSTLWYHHEQYWNSFNIAFGDDADHYYYTFGDIAVQDNVEVAVNAHYCFHHVSML
jgi:hypothetical protein